MKPRMYLLMMMLVALSSSLKAENPIIQTNYTADPAPLVYNNRLYLYTSHDQDNSTWFTMNDWKLYSTNDMVNWTDHGVVLSYKDFDWSIRDAWAPQCVERAGKFYMYVPLTTRDGKGAVGVAVSQSPYGPFIDPLGKPLVQSGRGDIDPTAFVDSDGQAYLYWGNPYCYYVKLNEDMISYQGEIVKIPMTEKSFGKRNGNIHERPTLYEEAPWLYKRNNLYYLLWAGGPLPEHIGYSTSSSPVGPWEYRGTVMATEGGSFTNHSGIVDFRGKSYFFYHDGALPGGGGFTRSVCVEECEFNADGTIAPMKMTQGVTKAIATINPYIKNEAETIAFSKGVKASQNKEVGVFVTAVENGAYTKVKQVDFRENGASKFTARVGTTHNDGVTMEVYLDDPKGTLLGRIKVANTGGSDRWSIATIDVAKVTGVHDLYFVFKGDKRELLYFDYWRFSN